MTRPFPHVLPATGLLLEAIRGVPIAPAILSAGVNAQLGVRGWRSLIVESAAPWLPNDEIGQTVYRYNFIVRESGRRLLLLGSPLETAEHLLRHCGLSGQYLVPLIDVPEVVKRCMLDQSDYRLGAVYARVDAYGVSMRTIAMFGDHLGDAALFKTVLSEISPYRIRLRSAKLASEVLSVDSRGTIGFMYRGKSTLRDADRALAYLTEMRAVRWQGEDANAR